MSRTGLAIFVKTPGHSPVKTRLAAGRGQAFADGFHRRSAQTVAEVALAAAAASPGRSAAIDPHWAVAEAAAMTDPAWQGLPRLAQGSGSLGERMARVHATLLARHRSALLIGADTPQITPAQLQVAAEWLDHDQPRCVLGPAADGGFWLFGSNRPVALARWTAVAYSRPNTADAFRMALHDVGERLELQRLVDADDADDLDNVLSALSALEHPLDAQRALADWLRLAAESRADTHPPSGAQPTHA
ncbi:TIGR04282 family arsenosugar biosynthesis glycosyltransferase [Alkalisalibacterium limincola]|uniref:DUF2064 domain-containing protein n=1 Tax=Alkalisalibacterium limincola TaxID=2699169 RepID=A0A5C8KSA0_9GAMM|nr:DUF2064 domain-containing protein [Alkalisalibacterium limincola]TXK62137.1 DUF2064 domain-containing protein [Alkalisalibacterium limincola]